MFFYIININIIFIYFLYNSNTRTFHQDFKKISVPSTSLPRGPTAKGEAQNAAAETTGSPGAIFEFLINLKVIINYKIIKKFKNLRETN